MGVVTYSKIREGFHVGASVIVIPCEDACDVWPLAIMTSDCAGESLLGPADTGGVIGWLI